MKVISDIMADWSEKCLTIVFDSLIDVNHKKSLWYKKS